MNRLQESYDFLVDETESLSTTRNERKAHLLRYLLEFCEYLLEEEDKNPLKKWFGSDPNAVSSNDQMKHYRGG
jgi:hypothetical protein